MAAAFSHSLAVPWATAVPLFLNQIWAMFGRFGLRRLPPGGLMADRMRSSFRAVRCSPT